MGRCLSAQPDSVPADGDRLVEWHPRIRNPLNLLDRKVELRARATKLFRGVSSKGRLRVFRCGATVGPTTFGERARSCMAMVVCCRNPEASTPAVSERSWRSRSDTAASGGSARLPTSRVRGGAFARIGEVAGTALAVHVLGAFRQLRDELVPLVEP
jgi:hypothetical protein